MLPAALHPVWFSLVKKMRDSLPDNPFASPGLLEEAPVAGLVDGEPTQKLSALVLVAWCLLLLIAMVHFAVCWVVQDFFNGILFCLTGVVGFILLIPTRGTMTMGTLYAVSASAGCGTWAAIQAKGPQTIVLLCFALTYAISAAILGYIGYQERLKTYG